MSKGSNPRQLPRETAPKLPNLDSVALHDAKLLCKIILGALLVDWLFLGLDVPIVGPPHWFVLAFETILFAITLVFGAAAAVNGFFSIYFHFRDRVRTRT